jgi:hypothetical protein
VLLKDVARIELGAETYGVVSRVNGHPGAGWPSRCRRAPTRWPPPSW